MTTPTIKNSQHTAIPPLSSSSKQKTKSEQIAEEIVSDVFNKAFAETRLREFQQKRHPFMTPEREKTSRRAPWKTPPRK